MNITEWFEKWLFSVKGNVKPSSYVKYAKIVRLYIKPYIQEKDISFLNVADIEKIIRGLKEKCLSASTINSVIMVINIALTFAEDMGLLNDNPCRKIKRAKPIETTTDAFTKSEQERIEKYLSTCKNKKLLGVKLCLYLGLRIGELLALTWDDVNFVERTITVNKTIDEKGNVYLPKTKAGIRILPIPKYLFSDFKTLKKNSAIYVIETDGHYTNARVYRDSYNRMLKRIKVRPLKFHALRHTFATRAIEYGIDPKTLSELMGHSNVSITLNRYTHTQMEQKRKALNRLKKSE